MRIKTAIRILPCLLLAMSAANAVVAVRVWLTSGVQPQVSITMVETPKWTNTVVAASAPQARFGLLGSSAAPALQHMEQPVQYLPQRYSGRYQYCRVNGLPYAIMHGERYTLGMLTAYGRIVQIYPERIFLEGGDYIENHTERTVQNDNSRTPANG